MIFSLVYTFAIENSRFLELELSNHWKSVYISETATKLFSKMKFVVNLVVLMTLLSLVVVISGRNQRLQRRSTRAKAVKQRERYDKSVNEYMTERTCFFNEICKEEFTTKFRCRCPLWSFCSSPGRYYNAYCSMSSTGYLWSQDQPGPVGGPYYRDRPPYKLHL